MKEQLVFRYYSTVVKIVKMRHVLATRKVFFIVTVKQKSQRIR